MHTIACLWIVALASLGVTVTPLGSRVFAKEARFSTRGPTETTPSYAQYFSWINNTNEGSTEKHTMTNLAFFRWLHDEYGMVLDIYAWDAGNIDGPRYYGSMSTDKFKGQFPNGWGSICEYAKAMGTRLGIWLGPDGYGDTTAEEKARHDLLLRFCKDYGMALFKMDAVCSQLRQTKQEALKRTLVECRRYVPDLILLNHRLRLGVAEPHVTTFLWGGAETYIDVHMSNWMITATHNRAGALRRGLPPELKRLTEDHGVCISSCPDFWDDDLILQAFNRCLILSPEMYGNPWFLRDDEYPKLARIYNLHRRWRDIMVNGIVLPEEQYGPNTASRGDNQTRLITLCNLTWEPVTYTVTLDETIGLTDKKLVELRRFHPTERIFGRFEHGSEVKVQVLPFRVCLLLATTRVVPEVGVNGCDYQVVRDVPGKPVVIKLLGLPGREAKITLAPTDRTFTNATLAGHDAMELLQGKSVAVTFDGDELEQPWHRKLGDLQPTVVPADAEVLYEATCFAGNNNALEYRAAERSGPTNIKPVRAARDMFFGQQLLRERGCYDRFMFDGNEQTHFGHRGARAIRGGALHLDFGKPIQLKNLVIHGQYNDSGVWNIIAPKYLINRDGKPGGLTGEYFKGSKLEGQPVVTRTDRQIDFRWRREPIRGIPSREFSVRWTGKIKPTQSGDYQFVTRNDDGARLWVGGKLLKDEWAGRGTEANAGRIELEAGQAYDIKLEFFNRSGGAAMQLGWRGATPSVPQVSSNLTEWRTVPFDRTDDSVTVDLSDAGAMRYFRMPGLFTNVTEITGKSRLGRSANRDNWRGSNLFASYAIAPAEKAWQCSFELDEATKGAYLCIAVNGRHGRELAYAALRVDGKPVGCPKRAPSYPANPWEYPVSQADGYTTYYVPVTEEMLGKPIDAVVLGLDGCNDQLTPTVWITAYPIPYESVELIME